MRAVAPQYQREAPQKGNMNPSVHNPEAKSISLMCFRARLWTVITAAHITKTSVPYPNSPTLNRNPESKASRPVVPTSRYTLNQDCLSSVNDSREESELEDSPPALIFSHNPSILEGLTLT